MSEETFDNTWPKSTRLNQANRELFVKTVIEDLMPSDDEPRLHKFAEKWGPTVYESIYTPYLEKMKALPKWMFTEQDTFHVDVFKNESPNDPIVKQHNGTVKFQLPKKMFMAAQEYNSYSWQSSGNRLAELPDDHEVIQALKDHYQAEDDWSARGHELRQTLTEVVEDCNTSHQLFRAWPKAVKYAEECFPYVEPAEAKRGGQTSVSSEQLDLTAKLAKTVVGVTAQN